MTDNPKTKPDTYTLDLWYIVRKGMCLLQHFKTCLLLHCTHKQDGNMYINHGKGLKFNTLFCVPTSLDMTTQNNK